MSKVFDAIVIGAGHAGLAVSQRLAGRGLEHIVLEREEIGQTWREQRWDSFRVNSPNWMNGLPGTPYAGDAPDAFPSTREWVEHLERHVLMHSLPVRTHTDVTAVEAGDGQTFVVTTATGDRLRTRTIVVASGGQNVPKVPASAREIDPKVQVLTTATYKRPTQPAPGAVLVVGGAQSGCQIAEELLDAGREVYLAVGKAPRVPRRLRGRDVMFWFKELGISRQRPEDLPDPAMIRWPPPLLSGVGPLGHTLSYQSLAARGATLLGHFEGVSGGRLCFATDLAAHIAFADERSAFTRRNVDKHLEKTGIAAPPSGPDPADEPVADPARYAGPTELDPRDRGISSVIFSTGFGGDFSWLRVPTLDAQGAPVHVEGRSPVHGIWFIGLTWLRHRASAMIDGAEDDSAFVIDGIARQLGARPPLV